MLTVLGREHSLNNVILVRDTCDHTTDDGPGIQLAQCESSEFKNDGSALTTVWPPVTQESASLAQSEWEVSTTPSDLSGLTIETSNDRSRDYNALCLAHFIREG